MAKNDAVSSSPPQTAAPPPRPTIVPPPRDSMAALFTGGGGSGFGVSPGPMTLVSSFFSENEHESECGSFSQLLAGAMASPAAPRLRFPGDGNLGGGGGGGGGRPPALVVSQPQMFMIPAGLTPGSLLDSPGLFPGQGPFGMSHQQALAQVTAQANMSMQATFPSTVPPPVSLPQFPSMPSSSASDTKVTKESISTSDQRSHFSSITVDKPADDGYNWRKYGQKQVKGSEFPRSYYKCTHPNCPVKKKVERALDGQVTEIIYKGQHNHEPPQKRTKDHGNSSNQGNAESGLQVLSGSTNRSSEGMTFSLSRRDQESSQATAERLSSDGEEVGDEGTGDFEGDENEPDAKRRNTEVRVSEQASSHRTVTEPRIIVQTTSEVDLLDDGYRWRKYGQKVVKGNPYPRSYYKCTHPGCNVRKHVERAATDPKAVITTYEGKHNHDVPAARTSSHNTANNSTAQLRPPDISTDNNTYVRNSNFPANSQQPIALLRLKEERIT